MSAKEKPAHGGNRERAEAEKTTGRASLSLSQYNTVGQRPQGPISRFLLFGQQNAVPLQQLVKLSGLDNRTARRLIEIERRAGTAICSDNRCGYFLAENEAELWRFVRSMQHRAAEIWKTARSLDDSLQQVIGQERVEE